MIDLGRITNPLRLARGTHKEGSGKGCAMNVVSYVNGDKKITDYPSCSARPLASIVQSVNDRLAEHDGYLSPKNSIRVLKLAFSTMGTAYTSPLIVGAWYKKLEDSPGGYRFSVETITVAHAQQAISAWRWLAGLDGVEVNTQEVDNALDRMRVIAVEGEK